MFSIKLSRLQLLTHFGAIFPLLWLFWDYLMGNFSVNPIQDLTQRTGKTALVLLVLSLACTPANTLFGFRQALTVRRALGLYAFFYASIHFMIFIGLDYGFDWGLLQPELAEKPYVWVGLAALTTLLPLALTSTKGWKKRLGKKWKLLHRLVYLTGILVVVHYAWVTKGEVLRLQGDILQPLAFGALVASLLVLRIPAIRKRVAGIRVRLAQRRALRTARKKPAEHPLPE